MMGQSEAPLVSDGCDPHSWSWLLTMPPLLGPQLDKQQTGPGATMGLCTPSCWADIGCPQLLLRKGAVAEDKGALGMALPRKDLEAALQ